MSFQTRPYDYMHLFLIEPPEGGELLPFHPTDVQADLLPKIWDPSLRGPSYHVVLKARRMGVTAGVQYLAFSKLVTTKNYVVSDIAHRDDSAAAIARYLKLYWETMPEDLVLSLACSPSCDHPDISCAFRYRRERYWQMIWGSKLQIYTAGSEDAARATGSQFLHLSEAAFYPDAAKLMRGLMPTLPKSTPGAFVVVESTGAGAEGWFYETYQMAKEAEAARLEGRNPSFLFRPHFYPWYADSRYRIDGPLEPDSRFAEEEEYLRGLGLDDSALNFRRYIIDNEFGGDQEAFRQEYPTTESDAFRRPDLALFPHSRLRAQLQRAKKPKPMTLYKKAGRYHAGDDPNSHLWIYEEPKPNAVYLLAADPAVTAGRKSDYAAAVVWGQAGQKLEVKATLRTKADVESFGGRIEALGRYYNTATICPDQSSGVGRHLIAYLMRRSYPRLWQNRDLLKRGLPLKETIGIPLTRVTKELIVSEMVAALWQDSVILNCSRLIDEMMDYTENPPSKRERYGPLSSDGHDDLVDAAMIGLEAWMLGNPKKIVDTSGWDTYLDILRKMGVPVKV